MAEADCGCGRTDQEDPKNTEKKWPSLSPASPPPPRAPSTVSLDDCFIPTHSPLHEHAPSPCARWRRGYLSQLDLGERAPADSGKVRRGGSHGEEGVQRRTLQILNRPVAVPLRRLPPPLGPLPVYKENLHVFPEELKRPHHFQAAVSRAASKGRYARLKKNLHVLPEETMQQHNSQDAVSCATSTGRSRAGWMSKERSTPDDINLEQHAEMFKCPLPQPPRINPNPYVFSGRPFVLKQRKPPEVRNALREKRMAFKQYAARNHAEVALCKYNRANNTKFELVEVKVISIFYEFGGGCIHYNFTAKQPEDRQSTDAGSTKLFFSEVDYWFRNENDVLLCCIVGENDAGHCHACEGYQPVVHPSSQAYGGGSSTCIDYPGSDGDSTDTDSD